MRLSAGTVLFSFHGIPILGSRITGDVIGLSPAGADLCKVMQNADVSRQAVDAVDPRLAGAFERGGFLAEKAKASSPSISPVMAYVHVTQNCNLTCYGCYSADEKRNCLPDAACEDFAIAFEKLASIGTREIIVSGGEPFLRDDLGCICANAKEAGIEHITVISNGTRITASALESVAPYADCVSISFDGASADAPAYVRGAQRFDQLVEAVRLVKQSGMQAHIIPTIHRKNVADMPAYAALAESLGATINFSVLSCCTGNPDDPNDIAFDDCSLEALGEAVFNLGSKTPTVMLDSPISVNLSIRKACGAGTTNLSVGADGTVYPCHMLHYEELSMGNIFKDNMMEIMLASVALTLSETTVETVEGCETCEYACFCGAGCRARAYAETKSLVAKDPFCPMTRRFYSRLGASLAELFGPQE